MGDVLDGLAEHLSPRQRRAASLLLAAIQTSHGSSGGLITNTSEKVDTSRRPAFGPPPGGPSMTMLERMLKPLRAHERETLRTLITEREPGRSLADYGRARCAYSKRESVRGFAVGRVSAMLETIAEEIDRG